MKFVEFMKKNEKGSITIFVLTAMLLFVTTLSIVYVSVSNKINVQKRQIQKIQEEYGRASDKDAQEQAYNETLERIQ